MVYLIVFVLHNLRDGKMLFEIENRGVRRGFSISNNLSTPRRLFGNNHKNKYFMSTQLRQQNGADRFPL